MKKALNNEQLEPLIHTIRGHRVLLDADLARLYDLEKKGITSDLSQLVIGSAKHRDPRLRPWAFTEHGALMAANILRSERAVQMSVFGF